MGCDTFERENLSATRFVCMSKSLRFPLSPGMSKSLGWLLSISIPNALCCILLRPGRLQSYLLIVLSLLCVPIADGAEPALPANLSQAVSKGDLRAVRRFLALGATLDQTNQFGETPLFLAVAQSNVEITRVLLHEGANPDIKRADGWNALSCASTNRQFELLQALIDAQSSLDLNGPHGLTPAMCAALAGRRENLELLQAAGARFTDDLTFAAALGDRTAVKSLLRTNDLNCANEVNWSPLAAACSNGHVEVVKLLLEKGAQADSLGTSGEITRSGLMLAARNGHLPVVEALLKAGANPSLPLSPPTSALSEAIWANRRDIVQALLDYGADVNSFSPNGEPVIFQAARDRPGLIELLLDRGGSVNATNAFGATPLIVAAYFGNIESVRTLLKRGARLSSKTTQGFTALQVATRLEDRAQIVKLLSNPGPVIEGKSTGGELAARGKRQ